MLLNLGKAVCLFWVNCEEHLKPARKQFILMPRQSMEAAADSYTSQCLKPAAVGVAGTLIIPVSCFTSNAAFFSSL